MSDGPNNPRRPGRPDDVRRALLHAAMELNVVDRSPTLREIVRHANVGSVSGRNAVKNMRRAGLLVVTGERRVSYRSKPVAEYAPACPVEKPKPEIHVFDFTDLNRFW